jgi:DNA repair exonuclease SbcCD nuclease subunit
MRVALIADLHIGVKKSDQTFQASQLKFFKEQFVPELKEEKIDTIIVCGDVFDTRQSVNVHTENVVLDLFKNVLADFTIHIIVGNHDMYHTTTTEINSLKALDLLPNVTVYEGPTEVKFGKVKTLMLPWITKYEDFDEIVLNEYDYAFAHLDVVGFNMGCNMMATDGLDVKKIIKKFKHTFTGHYHARSTKMFDNDHEITYIGSPYQITRADRGEDRGYMILDLDTAEFEWKNNTKSMIFTKYVYPIIDKTKIAGNQVDIEIPFNMQNETKKIYDLVNELNALGPAYPINTYYGDPPDADDNISIDVDQLNLISLFKSYIEQIDTTLDKRELYDELIKLYDMFKGANS